MAASIKFLLFLTLAVAAVVVSGDGEESQIQDAVVSPYSSNDLTLGKREKGDKLVAKLTVKASKSLTGKKVIREKTIDTPKQEITYVKAMDRAKKNGASVEVSSGGIGTDSITLRFKSQRLSGIDYQVQVFAKKAESGSGEETEEEDDD